MPTNIRIIHAHDFIRATPEGQIDLEGAKKLLIEVASTSTPQDDYQIMLDVRKSQSVLSVTNLWYLAKELSNFGKAFHQETAVLISPEGCGHAAFFALCAQNRGFRVEVFTSFEEAFEWLIANGT